MSNICEFDRILKTECNLQHFTRNCRIKNLDEFERDGADAYLWRRGLLNVKHKGISRRVFVEQRTFKCEGEGNDHMLHYEQVFGNVSERRESKCCGVSMKHRQKVKSEQMIIFQMAQQLQTKNFYVVPGQLFWRQCKANFLLETDSLY